MASTSHAQSVVKPSRYLLVFALCFLLWLLLTGSLAGGELLAGVVVAMVVSVMASPRLEILDGIRFSAALPKHLVGWFAVFTVALVRANVDVARRVLSPSLPLRPAMVKVRTNLTSPLGKLLLANSITLTPGTLSVNVEDDAILVHWIDSSPGTDLETATQRIADHFERHLGQFLY